MTGAPTSINLSDLQSGSFTGYVGSKGDAGTAGAQGNIGYTGSAGTNGYSGSVGYTGSAGAQSSDTQVIFNNSGGLVGNAGLTFVYSSNTLYVNGAIQVGASVDVINSTGIYTTGTVNAASHTVGSAWVSNASGAYTTGVINATSLSVGALFTANSTLVNAAAVNVTGQVNTATIYASTSANIAGVVLANSTGVYVGNYGNTTTGGASVNTTYVAVGNSTANIYISAAGLYVNGAQFVGVNTATAYSFSNVITVANTLIAQSGYIGSGAVVANATGIYTTGVVNAATLSVGTSWISNSTGQYSTGTAGINATAFSVGATSVANTTGVYTIAGYIGSSAVVANATGVYTTGVVNAASHTVGSASIANATGVYTTGTVNAASHTVGSASIANATGVYTTGTVNAASLSIGTLFTANSTLVNAAALNVVNAINAASLYTSGNANIGGNLTVTGNLYVDGTQTFINTTVISTGDLNFVLAANASTNALANGAGIVIIGTGALGANLVYNSLIPGWSSNVAIIPSSNNLYLGNTSNLWNVSGNNATLVSANVGSNALTVNTTALAAGANLAMGNNYITAPVLKAYSEFLANNATATGATTLDLAVSNYFNLTLTGNVTLTYSNTPSGRAVTFTIIATQDATGGRTITFPAGTKYSGGTSPPATTTAAAVDVWTVTTYNGGTTWLTSLSIKNAS